MKCILNFIQPFNWTALQKKGGAWVMKEKTSLTRREKEALFKFVSETRRSPGRNLSSVRLFGSKARGQTHMDTDIDVMVAVHRLSNAIKDTIFDTAFDINLEFNAVISPRVVPRKIFFSPVWRVTPFVRNVKKEGIFLWQKRARWVDTVSIGQGGLTGTACLSCGKGPLKAP